MINIGEVCAPALIFIIFSFVQMVFDLLRGAYNTAFFKGIMLIMGGILLQILCQRGLSVVSWVIIFIPFIFMSVIVAVLLYTFGLDPETGTIHIVCDPNDSNCSQDENTDSTQIIIRQGNIVHV